MFYNYLCLHAAGLSDEGSPGEQDGEDQRSRVQSWIFKEEDKIPEGLGFPAVCFTPKRHQKQEDEVWIIKRMLFSEK